MRIDVSMTQLKHLAKAECHIAVMLVMIKVCHYFQTEILPFYLVIENVMNMLAAYEKRTYCKQLK
jgi:hypothetical protein